MSSKHQHACTSNPRFTVNLYTITYYIYIYIYSTVLPCTTCHGQPKCREPGALSGKRMALTFPATAIALTSDWLRLTHQGTTFFCVCLFFIQHHLLGVPKLIQSFEWDFCSFLEKSQQGQITAPPSLIIDRILMFA